MMTQELKSKAEAAAKILGLSQSPDFTDHWGYVADLPGGGRLFFSNGRAKGQLHISASLPDKFRDHRPYYRDGEGPKTSINMSVDKTPQQIASDINRRLMPEYDKEFEACLSRKNKHDEYMARRVSALLTVAAPLQAQALVECDTRSGEPRPLDIERDGKFKLTIKPYDGSAQLEITASPDIAAKIAGFLATL